MSIRQTCVRRRGHGRRTPASLLMIGGAVLLVVVAGFVLLGSTYTRGGEPAALETRNMKGSATAPVEVEEWSDFQ